MILSNLDGYEKQKALKQKYELEIELMCLNSHFINKQELYKKLEKYQRLEKDFTSVVVLKESEFHEESSPYYEMSLFCNEEMLEKFKLVLEDREIKIDLIHKK